MKNSGKSGKGKGNKPEKTKSLNRGNSKPPKAQKIIKASVRGR